MSVIATLARIALLAYPSDFRTQFGEQIVADIEHDPSHAAGQILDIVAGGIAMRFDAFGRNASYAIRRLRSAPLFVAIVILTFALGIGANIAVFSVLNSIVLRPLPFPHSSALTLILVHSQQFAQAAVSDDGFAAVSVTDAQDLRTRVHSLELATAREDTATLLVDHKPYTVEGLDVTTNFFPMLGIAPQLGRILSDADANAGADNVVISNELWHDRFNADPAMLNRTVSLGGKRATIVGILAPHQAIVDPNGGHFASGPYFLGAIPNGQDPASRGNRIAGAIARLAPGATLEQANAELALVSQRLQKLYPHWDAKITFSARPLDDIIIGPATSALWLVFAAVCGILLIACANVGNLLAARWSARDREFAVRRALGASTRSIAGQLLVETGLLATLGTLLGIAFAYGSLRAMAPAIADSLPRGDWLPVQIDGWALLYAAALVVVTTLLAGLAPLLSMRSNDLLGALKAAGRGGDASARNRLRSALVIVEVALALALVVVSGLMVRNFVALVNTPLGIRPAGLIVSDVVALPPSKSAQLVERLRALPGVQLASLAMTYPLSGYQMEGSTPVAGQSYPPGGEPSAKANAVSPGYFQTVSLPLLQGRDFSASDTANSVHSVIVNRAFVDKYLAGKSPVGTHLILPPAKMPATIVGVVANERATLTEPPGPEFYQPAAQVPQPVGAVVYAPAAAAGTIEHEVQDAFAQVMPSVQPPDVQTMGDMLYNNTAPVQFATLFLASLASIALLLALAGVFGVVSFSVAQRRREFGVRVALGATSATILADVLQRALITTAVGVAIGLVIAAATAHAIASQINEVSPFDPPTFVGVIALIFACSALAALFPALRATHVQPAEALRYE